MNDIDMDKFVYLCNKKQSEDPSKILKDKSIWIFGAGNFAKDLCKVIQQNGFIVQGFVVSNTVQDKVFELPVVSLKEFCFDKKKIQLVFGVFNRETPFDKLKGSMKENGFDSIFMPWDIYTQFGEFLGWRFWLSSSNLIINSLPKIKRVFNLLEDEASKQCLLNICAFRLGVNDSYASFKHSDNQYFNQITLEALNNSPVKYVDMGAYNGDTVIELSKKSNLVNAYLFEPDFNNFNNLVESVSQLKIKSLCFPLGVSDSYKILSFSSGNGEACTISDDGNMHIATASLDEILINHDVNFIKMDIEGAEALALIGAKKIIKKCRPILAISYYHKPDDIWEIPLLLEKQCENYKFYLRQHLYNSFESVLYAIPS